MKQYLDVIIKDAEFEKRNCSRGYTYFVKK